MVDKGHAATLRRGEILAAHEALIFMPPATALP